MRTAQIFIDKTVIGEGTFGKVFKARIQNDKDPGRYYALKMIKMDNDKEGFPITAMREIKLLKQLDHENIVNLREIVTSSGLATTASFGSTADSKSSRGQVYLVFDYAEHDLQGVLEKGVEFDKNHFKCLVKQLIEGMAYLHERGIMHRDIKGGNILLTKNGVIKIADFGLARDFKKVNNLNFTTKVVTRWYRAPELLLGNANYTEAIDMWSVGCFIAEMFTGKPIFAGKSDSDQLPCIYEKLGVPTEESWKQALNYRFFNDSIKAYQQKKQSNPSIGMQSLKEYLEAIQFENTNEVAEKGQHLAKLLDPLAIDLILRMLTLNPADRITAK